MCVTAPESGAILDRGEVSCFGAIAASAGCYASFSPSDHAAPRAFYLASGSTDRLRPTAQRRLSAGTRHNTIGDFPRVAIPLSKTGLVGLGRPHRPLWNCVQFSGFSAACAPSRSARTGVLQARFNACLGPSVPAYTVCDRAVEGGRPLSLPATRSQRRLTRCQRQPIRKGPSEYEHTAVPRPAPGSTLRGRQSPACRQWTRSA
jgi:hypothetical protein